MNHKNIRKGRHEIEKQELLALVDSLGFDKAEYYILGSDSLLLHGLRDNTSDLDLCISESLWKELQLRNFSFTKNNYGFYSIHPLIEVVVNPKETFDRDFVCGYPVEKLATILAFKKNRNLKKDQADIEKITSYLEQQKNKGL